MVVVEHELVSSFMYFYYRKIALAYTNCMNIGKSYISLIHEFAAMNVAEGFTKPELMEYLSKNDIDVNDQTFKDNFDQIFNTVVFGRTERGDNYYFVKPDAYYRHLDYLEMKSAQESAKEARRWAIWAIVVSGILALLQVILAAIQLTKNP